MVGRVWTGPNDGAVRVANTRTCRATLSGTDLPPDSPARTRWKVSAAYRAAHDGQTRSRRLLHAANIPPAYSRTTAPVAASTQVDDPANRTGFTHPDTASTRARHARYPAPFTRCANRASSEGRSATNRARLTHTAIRSQRPGPSGCRSYARPGR